MRIDDGRVIPAFCAQSLQAQALTVFGDGTQTRSFCFVTDLVDGIVRLMESDLTEPCNLGNPRERNMLELAGLINAQTGNDAPCVFEPLPQDDPTRRRPDITRARTELGWEPGISLEEGLVETIAYFRAELGL